MKKDKKMSSNENRCGGLAGGEAGLLSLTAAFKPLLDRQKRKFNPGSPEKEIHRKERDFFKKRQQNDLEQILFRGI